MKKKKDGERVAAEAAPTKKQKKPLTPKQKKQRILIIVLAIAAAVLCVAAAATAFFQRPELPDPSLKEEELDQLTGPKLSGDRKQDFFTFLVINIKNLFSNFMNNSYGIFNFFKIYIIIY